MGFENLNIKKEYRSFSDHVVEDFYLPALHYAVSYKRAVGFFSSSALVELTKGISDLIKNGGTIQVIASPYLSEEDMEAIKKGYEERKQRIGERLLGELKDAENFMEEERLNLLANLIAQEKLDIKIVLLEKEEGLGMYHEKMGLLYDKEGNCIAFSGSMNESANAFSHNFEAIDVFCSWKNEEERTRSKQTAFEEMWEDLHPHIHVIEIPKLKEEIIKKYRKNEQLNLELDQKEFGTPSEKKEFLFHIPQDVSLKDYQVEAIKQWEEKGFRGIYDMATVTGKTFTALGSLRRYERLFKNLAVFILCPQIHLVNQWEEDVLAWGAKPIIAHSQAEDKKWPEKLLRAYRRFRRTGKSFVCIMTNATFCDEKVQNIILDIREDAPVVLVADEVHNLGARHLSTFLPGNIRHRLGLSATVKRHMDKEGTRELFQYFGERCITYPIERAIKEGALVPYEYYPVLVSLRPEELKEYQKLTKQLMKFLEQKDGKVKIREEGKNLLFKRSRLIAGAENKLEKLKQILKNYREEKHILVYCGATRGLEAYPGEKERQIDRAEKIIGAGLGMTTHRFTSEENSSVRKQIKEGFAEGRYQVVTAIKCLDEGVNIPNIHIAVLMASSRNPKEFIQRRGRVLRRSPGKNRAVIYDFITLPRELNSVKYGDFESDRAIVIGELSRIYEFGRYSLNFREADQMLEEIQNAYEIDIVYDDLAEMMEAEYGEE